jgi:hypothetical protein
MSGPKKVFIGQVQNSHVLLKDFKDHIRITFVPNYVMGYVKFLK